MGIDDRMDSESENYHRPGGAAGTPRELPDPTEEDSSTASPTQSTKSARLSVMPDPSLIACLFKSILPPGRQGLGAPDRGRGVSGPGLCSRLRYLVRCRTREPGRGIGGGNDAGGQVPLL